MPWDDEDQLRCRCCGARRASESECLAEFITNPSGDFFALFRAIRRTLIPGRDITMRDGFHRVLFLIMLSECDMRPAELAARRGVSVATISKTATDLGTLIHAQRNTGDRREVTYTLTAKGKTYLENLRANLIEELQSDAV